MAFILLLPLSSHAVKYYQSTGGSIKSIDAGTFDSCGKTFYRKAGSKGLTGAHKKALLKATLKAQVINDLSTVIGKLKDNDGSCTFGDDTEKFM